MPTTGTEVEVKGAVVEEWKLVNRLRLGVAGVDSRWNADLIVKGTKPPCLGQMLWYVIEQSVERDEDWHLEKQR